MLITGDPANIHYITTSNFSNYPKGSEWKPSFDILGNTLFNLDLEEWAYNRGLHHAFLSQPQFHRFFAEVLVDSVNKGLLPFLEHVANQGLVVDLKYLFKRSLFDTAWRFTTGYNPNTLSVDSADNQFVRAIDDASQAILFRFILPRKLLALQRWLLIGNEKKLSLARQTVRQIATKYISMKRRQMSAGATPKEGEKSFDFLQFVWARNDVDGKELPDEFDRDNVLGFTFGAYDTSSATLTWFFWLLSRNPRVEAIIREELDSHFLVNEGDQKWRLSRKEELSKLVYLHAALCETLRLYPPGHLLTRIPLKPDILPSGHHVNPKIRVVMSGFALGRMRLVWGDDSHEFKPERWISEKGELKYERSAKFFPFSAGPRICPGKETAISMLKATAATILFNFHVQVVETRPVYPKAGIVLEMKHGLRARIKSRWG